MSALRLLTGRLPKSPTRLARLQFPRRASSQATAPGLTLRTGLYTSVFLVSAGLLAAYYFDCRSAIHQYVLTPVVRHMFDPETGHKLAVRVLASGLSPRDTQPDDDRLKTELWGEVLSNPVGLAAGFDKNGEAVDGLFDLGFSWVEIGSVTPKPQSGNPRPRMFRLLDERAVINRYGFPSDGHTSVLARLRARLPAFFTPDNETHASLRSGTLLAVNLGKNKASPAESLDDFVTGVHAFGSYADVLVVNVSSPNTPGLRSLQSRKLVEKLLDEITKAREDLTLTEDSPLVVASTRRPKLLLKIAPDLDEAEVVDIAIAVRNSAIDGVIVSNTTIRRPSSLSDPNKVETGGLSGPPLKPYALATLRILRAQLPASIPIIGCGGISTGADALEFAKAGAAAVQVYTSFGYDGVGTCRRIKDELTAELAREGKTWAEVVRTATEVLSLKPTPADVTGQVYGGSVEQLKHEAEELMKLVDELSARVVDATDEHVPSSVDGSVPAVVATVA